MLLTCFCFHAHCIYAFVIARVFFLRCRCPTILWREKDVHKQINITGASIAYHAHLHVGTRHLNC